MFSSYRTTGLVGLGACGDVPSVERVRAFQGPEYSTPYALSEALVARTRAGQECTSGVSEEAIVRQSGLVLAEKSDEFGGYGELTFAGPVIKIDYGM